MLNNVLCKADTMEGQVSELHKPLKQFLKTLTYWLWTGVILYRTSHSWIRCRPLSFATLRLALFHCWLPKLYHRKVDDSSSLTVDYGLIVHFRSTPMGWFLFWWKFHSTPRIHFLWETIVDSWRHFGLMLIQEMEDKCSTERPQIRNSLNKQLLRLQPPL